MLTSYLIKEEDFLVMKNNHRSYCESNLQPSDAMASMIITTNNWFKAIGKNTWIDVISLDFSKAFDTVSHNKLLYTINEYGFSNSMYKWLESFLINYKTACKSE